MTSFDQAGLDAVLGVTSSDDLTGADQLDALACTLREACDAEDVSIFELDPGVQGTRMIAASVADGTVEDEDPACDELFWSAYPDSVCSWTDPGSPWYGKHPADAPLAPETAYPTWRAFRESRIMRGYGRAVGLGHYVLVPLSSTPSTSRRVLVNRPEGDRAYDDRELTMLRLLQPHLDSAVGRALTGRPARELLSERELEIMAWVRGGRSTRDIASILWVSPSTVRKHLENVYTKLDVHSRTEAVARVYGHGASTAERAS